MPTADSSCATPAPDAQQRRRRTITAIIIGILLLLLLLLLRRCHTPVAKPQPFDYFRAKAAELNNDPQKIVAFVRDTVGTLPYRGDVKGALGALWNNAASPEEKKALLDALFAAINKPVPAEATTAPSAAVITTTPLNLKITHRTLPANEDERAATETVLYDGPAGALVGDVHSIEALDGNKRRVTLRGPTGGAAAAVKEISVPADAAGEDLLFTWRMPGAKDGAPPETTARELWHKGNRTGARAVNVGDRHDFVVIPCRIGKYVREKEEVLLAQRGRDKAPEARAYLALLDYAMESDYHLAQLERRMKVRAQFAEPRVLILSRFVAPSLPGGIAYGIDLRIDRADFAGDNVPAYRASQTRSFLESSLEHQFLQKYSGLPSSSTFDVFTMIRDDMPDNCGRRVTQIDATVESLRQAASPVAEAVFSVAPDSRPKGAAFPKPVHVKVAGDGIHVTGGPILKPIADKLAAEQKAGAVQLPASGVAVYANAADAATAVETALLAADVQPNIDPAYRLATEIHRGPMSLVQKGARFHFQWGQGDAQTDQDIEVTDVRGSLAYDWRVQTGVLPTGGSREIASEALISATLHNPWYRTGSNRQERETSFVVSRKVYDAIKAGRRIDLSIEKQYGPKDDERASRPVDFTAPLTPAGTGEISVTVNGKPEKLPILKATLKGQPLAILDDPIYPIGMADALKTVSTAIACRLVDAHDVPIAGARVRIAPKNDDDHVAPAEYVTAPDGYFELPPAPVETDAYAAKTKVEVTFADRTKENVTVDLVAPGLATATIKVERPRTKLVYARSTGDVDHLKLSDEVKRQARRDVAAHRLVVIPDHFVTDGLRQFTAYYACDPRTGDYVGIMEDGLCGSSNWEQAVHLEREQVLKALKEMAQDPTRVGTAGAFQAFRGAVISWWVYCSFRTGGDSHKQAILDTLNAMKAWTDSMDLATAFGNITSDQLGDKLGDLLNKGTINAGGDAGKLAFQLGYIGGTLYLAEKLDGSDGE